MGRGEIGPPGASPTSQLTPMGALIHPNPAAWAVRVNGGRGANTQINVF